MRLLILVAFATSVCARQFNNPVLGGADYPDPGVLKFNGQYYAVTTSNNPEPQKFPIHISNDLQTWNFVGFALPDGYLPVWSTKDREYWAPEIHQIGDNDFRLFFTTRDIETDRLCIAVGASNNILGPYVVQPRPLQLDLGQSNLDATLVQDGNRKILIWKGDEWMFGRDLKPDCLSFADGSETRLIMRNDLPWEEAVIEAPWYVRRPDAWYMFYSGNGFCGDRYAVGVARSQDPLGPFEKRGDPILVSNDRFKGPGHCSVVPDINGGDTVMVYHEYLDGQVCGPFPRLMFSQSVGWGQDGWPFMIPN